MSKFKVGDKVILRGHTYQKVPQDAEAVITQIDGMDGLFCREIAASHTMGNMTHCRNGAGLYYFLNQVVPVPPQTKEQKAIAKAEADLAALKEKAAAKAKKAAELKAKRERAKLMAGLSKAGRRVVEMLRGNAESFGCQRDHVIALAAAITGDKADDIRKAIAK